MTLQAQIILLSQPIAEEHEGEKQAAVDRPGGELFWNGWGSATDTNRSISFWKMEELHAAFLRWKASRPSYKCDASNNTITFQIIQLQFESLYG